MASDAVRPGVLDDDERRALLARLLEEEGLGSHDELALTRRPQDVPAPLSFAQEVLWLHDVAEPGSTAYTIPMVQRIRGALDVAAFARAVDALVERHEALRTIVAQRGDDAAQIVLQAKAGVLRVEDVSMCPESEREEAAFDIVRELTDRPFALTTEPAFRVALVRLSEREHLFAIVTHHIVCDGWSFAILTDDLATLYDAARSGAPPPPPPALQFADFAAWQRRTLVGDELERRLTHWRERLAGLTALELPTDRPRGHAYSFPGARCATSVSPALTAKLRALAEHHDATLYIVLLAAWQTLLHRYSGQSDIVVGSAVSGRTRSEAERVVGYFSQALPMRTSFDGDPSFADVIRRVAETVFGAFDHQDVPLELLALEHARATGRPASFFRSVLTMGAARNFALRLNGLEVEYVDREPSQTKFDLTLYPVERDDGIALSLFYRSDAYDAATAQRMLDHLLRVLEVVGEDRALPVSRIPLLGPAERAVLAEWNATATDRGDVGVLAMVEAHVTRAPDAVALRSGSEQLTYAELDARANRLARALIECGVRVADRVGIALDRSLDAIAAIIAVWKAGGAYVPLAAGLPRTRRQQQLADSGVRVVVSTDLMREITTWDDDSFVPPNLSTSLGDVAYVLFTSGSTGTPKGVEITHRNLANYCNALTARLGLTEPGWSAATVSTLAADLGNTAIFPALYSGGTVHVIGADVATDATRFAAEMTASPVDVLKITPSHLRALLDGAPAASILPRRWLICGGEALGWPLAETVLGEGTCRVLNHYGPTETTIGAATFAVTAESSAAARAAGAQTVPIGAPLANVQLHVLDAHLQPLPLGIPGELYISGAGVAQGYAARADLTAERFVELPGIGRAYRTGDRVRRMPSGDLEFLGRVDLQVKIRGYRVELGEIEAVLAAHPAVSAAAVQLRADDGNAQLVAYVVPAANVREPLDGVLRAYVAEQLPDYMIPSAFVTLAALPLTANGKLDRAALPAVETQARTEEFVAPSTPTQTALARIWAEVLKCDRVGVRDDFFALGGHSLSAIRVLGKISRELGVRLALRTLFDLPTLEKLAAAIDERKGATSEGGTTTIPRRARTTGSEG